MSYLPEMLHFSDILTESSDILTEFSDILTEFSDIFTEYSDILTEFSDILTELGYWQSVARNAMRERGLFSTVYNSVYMGIYSIHCKVILFNLLHKLEGE